MLSGLRCGPSAADKCAQAAPQKGISPPHNLHFNQCTICTILSFRLKFSALSCYNQDYYQMPLLSVKYSFLKLVDLIESTIGAKFHQSLEIKFGGAVGKVSWRLDLEIKCLRRSNRKLAAARFNCFQMSIHLKTCPSWATQPNQSEDKDNLNCFCRSNCKLGNSTAVKYQITCRLDLTNALWVRQ